MLIQHPQDLDFSKFNRFFTIGCSFTHWIWPTWADIIAKNYDIEHYNYGLPGQSNEYILTMLSQITHKYHLTKTDLVMVMFTSWHRLTEYDSYEGSPWSKSMKDRILDNDPLKEVSPTCWNWQSGPDLIAEQALQQKYVSCDRGYAIRNYALIDSISTIFERSRYTGAYMQSVDPRRQQLFDNTSLDTFKEDVHEMYKPLEHKQLGKPMYDILGYELNAHVWESTEGTGTTKHDYHPYPIDYYRYLTEIGFDISEKTRRWVNFVMQIIRETDNPKTLEDSKSWPFTWYPKNKIFPL